MQYTEPCCTNIENVLSDNSGTACADISFIYKTDQDDEMSSEWNMLYQNNDIIPLSSNTEIGEIDILEYMVIQFDINIDSMPANIYNGRPQNILKIGDDQEIGIYVDSTGHILCRLTNNNSTNRAIDANNVTSLSQRYNIKLIYTHSLCRCYINDYIIGGISDFRNHETLLDNVIITNDIYQPSMMIDNFIIHTSNDRDSASPYTETFTLWWEYTIMQCMIIPDTTNTSYSCSSSNWNIMSNDTNNCLQYRLLLINNNYDTPIFD